MQTSEMFAFWRGGATEQIRDGSLNKKAVANQCSPRRRGDPPEIYPCGHKLRISATYEKNPLRPLGEPDFLCFHYTIDEHTSCRSDSDQLQNQARFCKNVFSAIWITKSRSSGSAFAKSI